MAKVSQAELVKGYEAEIAYQKHMLENIGRWLSLGFGLTMLGAVILYFYSSIYWVAVAVGIATAAFALITVLLGYVIYRGRRNLQKVIDDFEKKLNA